MIRNTERSHLQEDWLIIVNPESANGRLRQDWPKWEERLAGLILNREVHISEAPGSATAIIVDAVQRGIRHILAVGGDGMAHQVANGIMTQQQVPPTDICFALLPIGTGNDWVKSHRIPRAWNQWASYFRNAHLQRQNLGLIHYQDANGNPAQRYYLNVVGLAYDAFVVRFLAGKRSVLPAKLYYFWATFRCLFQYTPEGAVLQFKTERVQDFFYTINIGIGKYSGGGMQFVPHADPKGASMAITYVVKVSRLAVLLNSYRFYKGRIATYRKAHLTHATEIEISPINGHEVPIEADGEYLGTSPSKVTLVPQALTFLGHHR